MFVVTRRKLKKVHQLLALYLNYKIDLIGVSNVGGLIFSDLFIYEREKERQKRAKALEEEVCVNKNNLVLSALVHLRLIRSICCYIDRQQTI